MGYAKVSACSTCGGACNACFYTDECAFYNDCGNDTTEIKVKASILTLFPGRHDMPEEVEGSVFTKSSVEDPSNIDGIRVTVYANLNRKVRNVGNKVLVLYVTGLSQALVEAINWCHVTETELILMHYNPKTGDYVRQPVF